MSGSGDDMNWRTAVTLIVLILCITAIALAVIL